MLSSNGAKAIFEYLLARRDEYHTEIMLRAASQLKERPKFDLQHRLLHQKFVRLQIEMKLYLGVMFPGSVDSRIIEVPQAHHTWKKGKLYSINVIEESNSSLQGLSQLKKKMNLNSNSIFFYILYTGIFLCYSLLANRSLFFIIFVFRYLKSSNVTLLCPLCGLKLDLVTEIHVSNHVIFFVYI